MALAIDGIATAAETGSSMSATLTTTNAGDVIVAVGYFQFTSGATLDTTITDSAGLTWTLRLSDGPDDDEAYMFEYFAHASAALTSDTITVAPSSGTLRYGNMVVFGVSGAPSSDYFDANSSLPGWTKLGPGPTINTNNPNDLIFAFAVSGPAATAPSGWSQLGSAFGYCCAFYNFVDQTQDSLVVPQPSGGFGCIADAIVAAGAAPIAYPFRRPRTYLAR